MVSPLNALNIVRDSATYITNSKGGYGAVREICDLIISSKGSNPCLEFERYIGKR